jgi:hypothetical protein
VEEGKMKTDGQTLRGNKRVIPHVDLESVKGWANVCFVGMSLLDTKGFLPTQRR